MEGYVVVLVIIGLFIIYGVISWIRETISDSKKYVALKPKLDKLETSIKNHQIKIEKDQAAWKLKVEKWNKKIQSDKEEIEKIAKQKSMGFPWLAEAYADYFALKDGTVENFLKIKQHPAYTAAETVKQIKKEKRELVKNIKVIGYKIKYFETLFPWLSELIAEDEDDVIPVRIENGEVDDSEDNVRNFLTPEEYNQLPSIERNQKALDRYLRNRHKSNWAIGRDYEMYVGHLYKKKGYSVEYKGIIDGFEDLGRDIIATKNNEVCIIQCKYWAFYKEIHEKHLFQLFGTTMEFWLKKYTTKNQPKTFDNFAKVLSDNRIRPIFFTSTKLSSKAKEMAQALSIEVIENEPIGEFPRIKCNTNYNAELGKTHIYHLPMDQQYDRTIITESKGEFYAYTVKEAENAGFRRAFKHRY